MNLPLNRPSTRRRRAQSGFTMIEIMLVVMIIVLLLGFAINQMKGSLDVAKDARVQGDVQSIGTQLMIYETLNSTLPSSQQGLKALVTRPEGEPRARSWRKLMDDVPTDPYSGNSYLYVEPGVHNPDHYDLFSVGPDRKPNTADDIGNWKK